MLRLLFVSILKRALAVCAGLAALTFTAPAAGAQSSSLPALDAYLPPSFQAGQLPGSLTETEVFISTSEHRIGERSYRVSLPRNYDPSRAYPVVIGFGGWTEPALRFGAISQLHTAAGADAIVVYASGVNNGWGGAPYASQSRAEDIEYVRTLLTDLEAKHQINRDRVFTVGFSNGGGMASGLACAAPDLVAGAVSVGAAHYHDTLRDCVADPAPIQLIHGTRDAVIGYHGGLRHDTAYYSAEEALGIFAARNGCTPAEIDEQPVHNIVTRTPRDCQAATSLVRVEGGEHTWYLTPDTTVRALNFFRSF